MANGDTKTESYLRIAAEGTRADLPSDTCCNTKTQNLILGVANRIMDVEDEVEELKNNPDVVDIVDTYADLQAYDTSTLTDKDIIRVLEDSTHDNGSTYYRWNATTNQFDYIGEAGGGGPTVVQTTGTSTTDVMSQDATTKLVYTNSGTKQSVNIGGEANDFYYGVAIGKNSKIQAYNSIAIGSADSAANQTRATSLRSVSIGYKAYNQSSSTTDSVALGSFSYVTRPGEVNIGCGGDGGSGHGYNSTNYRVLGGVHDPVDAHDAATKGYVDTLVGNIESALHAINNGGNA